MLTSEIKTSFNVVILVEHHHVFPDVSIPEVFIEYYLLAINELSEVTETLKTTGYLSVQWTDSFLQWNPADFGNLALYHWPQVHIWSIQYKHV